MLKTINNQDRIFGLDLLRALAILFVMWGHGTLLLQKENTDSWIYYLAIDGVSIFFVLSGFLIGGIWIKLVTKSSISASLILNFWIRRWFRTLPNYYLILTILVILSATFRDFEIKEAIPYYGFLQNLNWSHPLFFAEAWSLSIEEWFYFLLPLLFVTLGFFRGKSVRQVMLFVILLVIFFSSILRFVKANELGEVDFFLWNNNFRSQVFTRLDSIMYGVLGAFISFYFPKIWVRLRKPALVLGLFMLVFHQFHLVNHVLERVSFGLYYQLFSFSVVSIGSLCLLPFLSNWKGKNKPWQKVFVFFSLTSYSLYLVNSFLVMGFIIPSLEIDAVWLQYLLFWLISIGLATLIYKYFEVPATKLRDRFS